MCFDAFRLAMENSDAIRERDMQSDDFDGHVFAIGLKVRRVGQEYLLDLVTS